MVEQYRQKHNQDPKRIVVSPVALAALAIQRTVAPVWAGIPVECREIKRETLTKDGPFLGVDLKDDQLVSFDLAK